MEIRRFFASLSDLNGDSITISGEEFIHMTKVLRMKVGFLAYICLNDGYERLCKITEINKDYAVLHQEEIKKADSKNYNITLYSGLLKNNRLDFTIQKCVELGVDKVVPFISQNTAETKFNLERAEKIAKEAAKQCGSIYLTEVNDLINFDTLLTELKEYDTVIAAYEFEKQEKIRNVGVNGKNIALIVGPEGGFKESEIDSFKAEGAKIVTLGKRILRAETAGIVASTILLDSLGELDYE